MTSKNTRVIDLISPLIYILVVFTLLDNYISAVFDFKTKIDEVVLLILNIGFFAYILRSIFIEKKVLKFEMPLVGFFLMLLVSSLVNHETGLLQKLLGSYFLIKSVNIFYLVYRFGISRKWMSRICYLVIYVAILSVIVQLIQFSVPNISSLTAGFVPAPNVTEYYIRCTGILGESNRTAQLFVIAYIVNRLLGNGIFHYRTLMLLLGLLLASSNLNLFAFFIVISLDVIRNNKKLVAPLGAVVFVGLMYLGESFFFRLGQLYELAYIDGSYFRLFAFLNSIEILGNNLFTGVGPGMYGGSVAAIMGSPAHEQYRTFSYYGSADKIPTTIDMFWPHLWAEIGILGVLFFLLIFIIIFSKNIKFKSNDFYLLNILLLVFALFGISTFSIESTFSSVIVYAILGSYMYWGRKNAHSF